MTEGDAEAVAALVRTAFAAIPVALDPPPTALRVAAADVVDALTQGGGAVWDEGGLQGCVLWRDKDRGLYIGRLSVRAGWRRRGIARHLIAAAEAAARARGHGRVLLEVRLAMPGNRRLFAAAGFIETAMRAHEGYDTPTYAEAEKVL